MEITNLKQDYSMWLYLKWEHTKEFSRDESIRVMEYHITRDNSTF